MKTFPCEHLCLFCKRPHTRRHIREIYCSSACMIAWDEARQVAVAGRAALAHGRANIARVNERRRKREESE